MRVMLTCECVDCHHEWLAAKCGACPKCHSDRTDVTLTRVNELKRL